MRLVIRGVVALVILIAAYWSWALVGAAQLASAAHSGDVDAVMERVDLQALIRSLASQISRAFLDENPQLQKLPAVRRGVILNGAAAEMLLRALLTPENIAALLSRGRVDGMDAGGKDAGTVWAAPSLGEAFSARPLQVLMNSHLDGPRSFVVGLRSPGRTLPRPHGSLRPRLAHVGRRHSRDRRGAAREPDRAEDRRSGQSPGRLSRSRVPAATGRPVALEASAQRLDPPAGSPAPSETGQQTTLRARHSIAENKNTCYMISD